MNRYIASSVPLESAAPASTLRKPLAVWATQILACIFVISPVITLVRTLRDFVSVLDAGAIAWTSLRGVTLSAFIITLLVVMVVQLQRRSAVGRWLAVTLIVFLIVTRLVRLPAIPAAAFDARWWAFMATVGGVLALLGWWLYAVGFSRKARAWFTKTAQVADPSAPS